MFVMDSQGTGQTAEHSNLMALCILFKSLTLAWLNNLSSRIPLCNSVDADCSRRLRYISIFFHFQMPGYTTQTRCL